MATLSVRRLPYFACDLGLQSGCDVVGHGDEPAKITLIFDEKKARAATIVGSKEERLPRLDRGHR